MRTMRIALSIWCALRTAPRCVGRCCCPTCRWTSMEPRRRCRSLPCAAWPCAARRSRRTFELQALYHCIQIEYLDSGVEVDAGSKIDETAQGRVRLSFGIDGWLSDPDGLKVPGPPLQHESVRWPALRRRAGSHRGDRLQISDGAAFRQACFQRRPPLFRRQRQPALAEQHRQLPGQTPCHPTPTTWEIRNRIV